MQSATPQAVAGGRPRADRAFWHGARVGLVPLVLVIGTIVATIMLTTLARLLFAPAGFLVWQWIVAGVWVGGLLITTAVFAYAVIRVLRLVAAWQQEGSLSQASGACWALGVTALIILLPLLVALVFPQHPAPLVVSAWGPLAHWAH